MSNNYEVEIANLNDGTLKIMQKSLKRKFNVRSILKDIIKIENAISLLFDENMRSTLIYAGKSIN